MDANGRLGSVQSEAVGGFAAEAENPNAAELHDMVRSLGMIIPATFEEWFQAGTWFSKSKLCASLQRMAV